MSDLFSTRGYDCKNFRLLTLPQKKTFFLKKINMKVNRMSLFFFII